MREFLADKENTLGQTVAKPAVFEARGHPVAHVFPEILTHFLMYRLVAMDEKFVVGEHQQDHHAIAPPGLVEIEFGEEACCPRLDVGPAMPYEHYLDFARGLFLGLVDRGRNLSRFIGREEFPWIG